jgi:hypothetical protein
MKSMRTVEKIGDCILLVQVMLDETEADTKYGKSAVNHFFFMS